MTLTLEPYVTKLTPNRLPVAVAPALYVHVPFCFHKCHYCDFYSITRQSEARMSGFVSRILREAELWTRENAKIAIRPETVFFGGGTPSLLPIEEMRRLLLALRGAFGFSNLREWTIECNPATVDERYLATLRESGVTRLSFGAQSFDRGELAMLERHHDPDDVGKSVAMARRAGFSRINVDLIFAIPGQTMQSWRSSLEQAMALGTPHISCYALTYEPNTPMAVKKRMGAFAAAEESLELEMLHYTRERLAHAGLFPYEISNFAVPGEECRHNLMYWRGENYIGLGPSAASHISGWRWKNRGHLGEWEKSIDAGEFPAIDVEHLEPDRRARELAMLMLRLRDGIDFAGFENKTGSDARNLFSGTISRYASAGLLDVNDRRVKLTERGINVADAIAGEFLST
jgi:oxygen-independent coproporphyrinogen III oxidase